jgi:hypothetical protein
MANSSILGGDRPAETASGKDVDALGPSDSSDSGSDVQTDLGRSALDEGSEGGLPVAHHSDTDSGGTGERGSADPSVPVIGADLMPDRIGLFPSDALDAALSIDDPQAVSADELADSEDEEEEDEDGNPVGDDAAAPGARRA